MPLLIFSVVAHEFAHGYVAYRQGDTTAYQLGRLTLNPLPHIDPFMTLILPIMLGVMGAPILAGAKPVPVNPRNYRNYKRGDILVSLAGVAVNFVLAFACMGIVPLLYFVGTAIPSTSETMAWLQQAFIGGIYLNLVLVAFNLLPIPPLDGSHVMKYLLPPGWALSYARVGRFGLLIIYGLLVLGFMQIWLQPSFFLYGLMRGVVHGFVLPLPYTAP